MTTIKVNDYGFILKPTYYYANGTGKKCSLFLIEPTKLFSHIFKFAIYFYFM